MSRDPIPLHTPDISHLARNLSTHLKQADSPPSHLSLMNLLARSAGFRNFQHLRAAHTAQHRLDAETTPPAADFGLIERCLRQFDVEARLIQWPGKRAVQELSLWWFWSRLPANRKIKERDVNGVLNHFHHFDDPAILRRSLLGLKLLTRKPDGTEYQRIERAPPAEARELIARLKQRRGGPLDP